MHRSPSPSVLLSCSSNNSGACGAYNIKLVCGSSNRRLAEAVAYELGVPLTPCKVDRFADGEINMQVFIHCSIGFPN